MPIPSSFSSPAPASFAVGAPALPIAPGLSSGQGGATSAAAPVSFDRVLTQLDDPASPNEKKALPAGLTDPAMTAEQLAMMMSMIMPNPALTSPIAPPLPPPATVDAAPSFKLMGAEGRSIPELLVGGVGLLEYQAVSPAATLPASVSAGDLPASGPAPGLSAAKAGLDAPQAEVPADSANLLPPSVGATLNRGPKIAVSPAATLPPEGASPLSPLRPLPHLENNRLVSEPAPAPTVPASSVSPSGPVSPDSAALAGPSFALADAGEKIQKAMSGNPPVDTENPATSLIAAGLQGGPANLPKSKLGVNDRPEKSAGPALSLRSVGSKIASARGKNVILTADDQPLDTTDSKLGTVAANGGKTMYQDSPTFAAASLPGGPRPFDGPAGSSMSTTSDDSKKISPAQAKDLVHEIREIADGLWSVERNAVEVKFNFGEQDRLSVRVEYRDGAVHATFRSDSPAVREAIASEWQAQSGVAEPRSYQVAEPVFASAQPTSGFFTEGDASRQQRSPQQQQEPLPFERFSPRNLSRSTQSNTVSPLAPLVSGRETTGRLHAHV